jgi:hypothetical protein
MESTTSWGRMTQEATRLVDLAEKEKIVMRLMGGCAIRFHCPTYSYLYEKLKRSAPNDADFMSYGKFSSSIPNLFAKLGYDAIHEKGLVYSFYGDKRHIYESKIVPMRADVLFDKFEMCFTIDFRNRLEQSRPTISLADMLLQKLQIVKINEKDIKDTIILLREHEIGENGGERVAGKYISKILASDWGFYYTFTTNLEKVRNLLNEYHVLTEEDRENVRRKIDRLRTTIDEEPKPIRWRMRSKVGKTKKWYTDVDELGGF